MTHKPVLSKRDFVERYSRGEFGNASPTWDTLNDFLASGYYGLVHIRNRVAGGPTWYNVRSDDVEYQWGEALHNGVSEHSLYISAMAPTAKTLIQGEVMQTENGLYFYHTWVRKPMRDALRESSYEATGLTACLLLQTNMNPKSYDWLMELLRRYPEHVVEVSVYDVCWGTLPGFNTCFWEVRKY